MIQLTNLTALKLTGEKTHAFLQGQLTCDMHSINQHGEYSFAACCDHRGRMVANFWVLRWQNDYLLILPRELAQTLTDHLKKYAMFSKVMIAADNHFFIVETIDCNRSSGESLSVAITLPNPARHLIISETKPTAHCNTSEIEFKKRNIEDGLCILCQKTSLLFTPQMINMEKLGGVSFSKGCYVGQEIVARTEYLGKLKKHLHRLQRFSEKKLNPGDEIENGVIVEVAEIEKNHYDLLAVLQDQGT